MTAFASEILWLVIGIFVSLKVAFLLSFGDDRIVRSIFESLPTKSGVLKAPILRNPTFCSSSYALFSPSVLTVKEMAQV